MKNRWNYYISKHLNDLTFKKDNEVKNDDKKDLALENNSISSNISLDLIDMQFDQADRSKENNFNEDNFSFLL